MNIDTQPPKEVTLVIAAVLWVLGFADVLLGAVTLGGDFGVWALALSGLLLIIGSLVSGI